MHINVVLCSVTDLVGDLYPGVLNCATRHGASSLTAGRVPIDAAGGPGDIKKYFPARCWFVEGKRTVTLSEGPMDEDFLTGPLSRRASDDSALSHVSVNSDLLEQLKGSFLDEAGK